MKTFRVRENEGIRGSYGPEGQPEMPSQIPRSHTPRKLKQGTTSLLYLNNDLTMEVVGLGGNSEGCSMLFLGPRGRTFCVCLVVFPAAYVVVLRGNSS